MENADNERLLSGDNPQVPKTTPGSEEDYLPKGRSNSVEGQSRKPPQKLRSN